jgi:hypothetical protein
MSASHGRSALRTAPSDQVGDGSRHAELLSDSLVEKFHGADWNIDRSLRRQPEPLSALKARQSSRIRELGNALLLCGYVSLDQQADALGLCRSTTWTLLRANHKSSGLSATIINRMLTAPGLPPPVRDKILEYVREKLAGLHGHNDRQLRRFAARLWLGQAQSAGLRSGSSRNDELD